MSFVEDELRDLRSEANTLERRLDDTRAELDGLKVDFAKIRAENEEVAASLKDEQDEVEEMEKRAEAAEQEAHDAKRDEANTLEKLEALLEVLGLTEHEAEVDGFFRAGGSGRDYFRQELCARWGL